MMMVHRTTQAASTVISQDTAESNAPKMDAVLKAKWIAALRSGEFKQGIIYFERNNKFCCLGVLCKVAGQPTETEPYADNWRFVESFPEVDALISKLVGMNDTDHAPFSEIADYIEANL